MNYKLDPYVSKLFKKFNTEILSCLRKLEIIMFTSINNISISTKVVSHKLEEN